MKSETRVQSADRFLLAKGAKSIPHPGGTLLAHLRRTSGLLAEWGNSEALVVAGLCHAAYGTDGFDRPVLDHSSRDELAAVVGSAAEAIIYLYASCDRRYTYPQIAARNGQFRNRFTGEVLTLERTQLAELMELTCANELDVARHNPDFAENEWPRVAPLFTCSRALLSEAAWQSCSRGPAAQSRGRAARAARG